MLHGGDWVIPHLNGLAYIEKPPLQYWATALSLRAVRAERVRRALVHRAHARSAPSLVVVAAGARGCGARRRPGGRRPCSSSMLLFLVLGQLLTLDMSLTFYMTVALAGVLAGADRGDATPGSRSAAPSAAGCCSPGPPRPSACSPRAWWRRPFPAAVLVLYSALDARFRRRGAGCTLAWGLPLFLAITVPWHWLAARRLAGFSAVLLRARAFRALSDAECGSRGAVVVLRRGVPARQRRRGRCRRCGCWSSGWRRARAARRVQSRACSCGSGCVFVCMFFSLSRFETHSLHLAGHAGARAC